MASYTDAIAQFNPYVQQLPVELMAKVGMTKQAQYDQGVQKIQNYIDNVAGLDVIHESDKEYLHSKLGQLGNKLKTVAAGDFSNQQLVNSVTGMTGQIVKDPTIQNAVASTAWYKKQKEQLDKDYQTGKSSVANVRDFDRQAEKWLGNKEAGQRFRGRYSPYIDLGKKWNEIIKAVHPMASSEDFAYQNFTDENGKVNTTKLAAAMTRITKEGVSSDQIENAIRSSLTPDDYNQIRIDAGYRFDNVDSQSMKGILASTYQSRMKQLDDTEKVLNNALTVFAGDPVQLEFAKSSIAKLADKRMQLKQGLENDLTLADTDLDGLKTNLYKEGAISQTASAFSWEKKAKELLTNPLLQAQFEQDKINLQKANLQETISQHRWDRQMDLENLKVDKEKLALDRQKTLDDKFGVASGFTTFVGEGTKNLLDPVSAISNGVLEYSNAVLSGKQILGNGNVAAADVLIKKYQNNVNSVTPQQASLIKDIIENENRKKLKETELQTAEANVLRNDPTLRDRKEKIDDLLKGGKLVNVNVGGKTYTFTPRELFNYASKTSSPYNLDTDGVSTSALGASGLRSDRDQTFNLTEKERVLRGLEKTQGKINPVINAQLQKYHGLIKADKKLSEDLRNATSTYLSTTNGTYIPAVTGIVVDAKSRPFYEAAASSALSKYSFDKLGIKGGSAMLSPSDAETARQWLSDEGKNNVQYQKLNYAGQQSLILTKEGKQIIIPLSPDQERQLPKLTGESNAFNEDINKIQMGNGNYSTNPTNDVNRSWYQPWNMQTSGLNVYADLNRDFKDPGIQYISLSLKNKKGEVYPLTLPQVFNANKADEFIRGLNNKDIKDLYLSSPKIPDSWKEQIRNL